MSDSKGAAILDELRQIIINLCDDWEHNLRADFPEKRPNPSNIAIDAILALLAQEVKEARKESFEKGYNAGSKDSAELERLG